MKNKLMIEEIEKTTYLEQKYTNSQSEEGRILTSFSAAKAEKENRLKDLVEQSLQKATSIYLYNTFQLDKDIWQNILQNQQRQIVQNVYGKRLESQISSEKAAESVIKEASETRLQNYFTGKDFQFFDAKGNFIGDSQNNRH